jgi:long-chain acyl-CoA synthetase
MNVTRTFDLLDRLADKFPKDVALAGKDNGEWKTYSTAEYREAVDNFSCGLLAIGIKKGDKIVSVSNSRPEWNIMDLGMAQIGAVHVPLYPNLAEEEYKYLISHSDCRMVITGNSLMHEKIVHVAAGIKNVEHYYTIDNVDGENNFSEVISLGKDRNGELLSEVKTIKEGIKETDVFTIIYTSGTTGTSKGVMLCHRNVISNAIAVNDVDLLDHRHKVLSFLPLCHIFERMANYHYQMKGISIYYAQNMGTVVNDLKDIKADGFTTVPRFLEKLYDGIVAKGKDLTGIKKAIFFWALRLGERYDPSKAYGPFFRLKLNIARKLVFSKWLAALGGNVKMMILGGAAMQERLGRIFSAAGICVQEGYGLTETSPVIAANGFEKENMMIGTVGPVLDGIECKIAEDGEILCKGPNVMLGYYKDDDYTAEVIDGDGWFHTGDIGTLVNGRFLKITDRKKSIFKLSAGKYIAPQVIENKLKMSDFIEQAMVVGMNEKYAAALISPNFNCLHFWATKHKIHYHDNSVLIALPEVIKRVQKEIAGINITLAPQEQIKKFQIVVDEWSTATGELSPTLKIKRQVVLDKYPKELEKMYGHPYGAKQ